MSRRLLSSPLKRKVILSFSLVPTTRREHLGWFVYRLHCDDGGSAFVSRLHQLGLRQAGSRTGNLFTAVTNLSLVIRCSVKFQRNRQAMESGNDFDPADPKLGNVPALSDNESSSSYWRIPCPHSDQIIQVFR